MSPMFTVKAKDLLGRIGIIRTKSGNLETPHMFPVIDPKLRGVNLRFLKETMKCNGVMANAYLLKKHLRVRGGGRGAPQNT
jgi:7-cyano-7-deazaguanine tRNA-ribosyltransferase